MTIGLSLRFILLSLLMFSISAGAAEMFEGRVVGVHDGDTITLLLAGNQQLKIRLAQIDAPESGQAFGQRSKQSLSELVFNKTIHVKKETIDKYGRTVGTLSIDGFDVNREQIKRGMAWAYRKYLHDPSLIQVEKAARQAKVGLWTDPNPMPPWEYRHNSKISSVSTNALPKATTIKPSVNFSCGNKHYCKEMTSCEEAMFYLTQCGLSHLDKDSDGIPCEKLCGHGR